MTAEQKADLAWTKKSEKMLGGNRMPDSIYLTGIMHYKQALKAEIEKHRDSTLGANEKARQAYQDTLNLIDTVKPPQDG